MICRPRSPSGKNLSGLDPKLADAHYSLGVTLWQSGDFPAATEQLRLAIQNQPDYAEAYYTLGTVLKQMDKLPDAAHALQQAILLQPDFAGAHTTLAAVLRQLGDTAGAAAPKAKRGPKSVSKRLTSRQPLSPPTHGR